MAKGRSGRARRRRSAFERRQRRRQTMTRAVIAAIVVLVSLGMVLTFIPGDLSAVFGTAEEDLPAPPDADETEVGGVACDGEVPAAADEERPGWDDPPPMEIDPEADHRATVETSCGEFVIELFADAAPRAVNNFVFLAGEGFYDGVIVHRVVPGFVIQGGDPTGTGRGGPGYRFEDELDLAEERGYEAGSVAMANAGPDTNGSQFFIVLPGGGPALEPLYSLFGEVVDGMDVIDRIAALPTDPQERPLQQVFIERVTVERTAPDTTDDAEGS